jgi:AraC family cel operon transcriptional repressor
MPDWLADALPQFGKPEHFAEGTAALARLAGRSPEHVAREVRRWTGKTPTDLLNEARLVWAARRLAAGDARIVNLAIDCGFESLGHFYVLFKKRFGLTPHKYRMDSAKITGV